MRSRVKIVKVCRPNNLKGGFSTDEKEGFAEMPPQAGFSFLVITKSLPDGKFRYAKTSSVQEVIPKDNGFELKTKSGSVYFVKEIKE
jgi:hypothetical protein